MIDINKYQIEAIKKDMPIKEILKQEHASLSEKYDATNIEIQNVKEKAEDAIKNNDKARINTIISTIGILLIAIFMWIFIHNYIDKVLNRSIQQNSLLFIDKSCVDKVVEIRNKAYRYSLLYVVLAAIIAYWICYAESNKLKPKGELLLAIRKYNQLLIEDVRLAKEINDIKNIIEEK